MFDVAPTTVSDVFKAIDSMQEADGMPAGAQVRPQEPKSAFIDPFTITNFIGPRAKPGPISYAILRYMATVPAVAAVINTRLSQVSNFTHRARSDRDTGFRIVLKDEEAAMTPEQKKQAHALEEFFLRTGWVKNRKRKDSFNQFMKKITRDTLTLDDIAIEAVPGVNVSKWPISEMYAVDAATIEVVVHSDQTPQQYVYEPVTEKGKKMNPRHIAYVQRVDGTIQAEYTEDELIRAHRNPRTDLEYAYYGYAELEQLITVVTGIINGLHYNTSYFTQSNLPQGVLEIVGKYDKEHLEQFKRAWTTLVSGSVGRQWKVPVMALEEGQGFKFTPFKQSNRDMEFSQFMEFLFNLACAVYQIDPREVGFKSWDSSGSKTMDNDAPASSMENSKDKGFYPLMQFFEDLFNYDILDRIAPDFRFEWVGLDEDRSAQEWAMEKDQLAAGVLTLRMYWDKHDVDYTKYADQEWIDLPANSVLAQFVTAQKQQEGQMQMQDAQHQNALEANLHQGIQQSALEKKKQEAQMQMQDAAHQNTLEAQMHQGVQQSGLERMKGEQALKQQDAAHQNTMEAQAAQGVQQQGLEQMRQKGQIQLQQGQQAHDLEKQARDGAQQTDMAKLQHQQTLKQKFADAGHARGMESMKQKGAKDLASHQHELGLEQLLQQFLQQSGLESKKLAGQKELQQGQQAHDLERQARDGMQKTDMAQLSHRLVLRQKFADAGHARGLQSQRQKGAERMAGLKQQPPQQDPEKKRKDLNKSMEADVLEIEIVLM